MQCWNKPMEGLCSEYSGAPWQYVISPDLWASHVSFYLSTRMPCVKKRTFSPSPLDMLCFSVRKYLHSSSFFSLHRWVISICCPSTQILPGRSCSSWRCDVAMANTVGLPHYKDKYLYLKIVSFWCRIKYECLTLLQYLKSWSETQWNREK